MPAGAIARLGSARWRLANEPRRIIVSGDGKKLAVVNSFSGVDVLDSHTGRSIWRAGTGSFSWGLDLRMAVPLSADWQKTIGASEDRSASIMAAFDRGNANPVKIEYRRKKELHPIVPEEVEESNFSSSSTTEYLSAAEFSPDATLLVAAVRFEWDCSGGKFTKEVKESHIIAWNASTGKEIWKTPALAIEVNTLLFSPDGKTLTVVDKAGVGFWDAVTGRQYRRWQSKAPLFSARYSPDRNWLATGSEAAVLMWEVPTGKLRRRLALPGKVIRAVAFSQDGKLLAGGGEKTIRFWDPITGKAHGDCSAFPSPVEALAFAMDGKTLFSGHDQEHALRRWDVGSRKPVEEINSPIAPVRLLSFSRDSRQILATATGDDFYHWETESGKACPLPKRDNGQLLTEWFAYSAQSALLRCEEGVGAQVATLLTGKVDRLDLFPAILGASVDGRRILVQSEKDKLPCLNVVKTHSNTMKNLEKRKDESEREIVWRHGDEVSAALSPDGKTVVAAGKDIVCFFDVSTGRERRFEYPTNVKPEFLFRTQSVKFSADGSRIALVGNKGMVRILAVHDGRRIAEFATKSPNVTGVAFSPDGQTLLTTAFNAPVFVWEVATGQMVRKLDAATHLFSPNNRLLAASSGTLKIFDLYSGRFVRECKDEGGGFGNFAFSPNSKYLAAGCSDTTILVWPTAGAERKAGKPLDEKRLAQVLEKGSSLDAYEAIGRMIADPERALAFLERRLRAMPKVDAKHVKRLVGERNEKQPALSVEDILHIRAIQALERIGTKRARQLLEILAQRAVTSPRTQAAIGAVSRMKAH